MIASVLGWASFLLALGLALWVVWIHRRGRQDPWLRVVNCPVRRTLAPATPDTEWRAVVGSALTAGMRVDAIEWSLAHDQGAEVRVADGFDAPDGWRTIRHDEGQALRVTMPGDGWADALERVGGAVGLRNDSPVADWIEWSAAALPSGNDLMWERARLVLRAPQVTIEVPLREAWAGPVSGQWRERVRDMDATGLLVALALLGSVGLVVTGSLVAMAAGVIGLVALSGACKFVFMSRRSDPTREQFLQNY
ncbi:hypothetical protein [Sulfuriroseicoccus oceanibius]|uniref:Uncharacterized protein n=1 Tax=Sulfuriroseicoccus oceanibius TaxID=2707525 RepID=A0A6B3LBW4_9BACT|nr:hypothetical protein [Sulfuriroseicoccus oceanibius]QQL45806.1 hypothetical protein G3M56_004270 [Sulfuriroseicoccus oceanibius]